MMTSWSKASPNFSFLAVHDPLLLELGARAERYVFDDPTTAIIKLRQFGEILARLVAAHAGLLTQYNQNQVELLADLRDVNILSQEVLSLFHNLRMTGNLAVHEIKGDQRQALYLLKDARTIGVWFHRTFKDPGFKCGPFIPPPNPVEAKKALLDELQALRDAQTTSKHNLAALLETTRSHAEKAEAEAKARAKAEIEAKAAYDELALALDMAAEAEAELTSIKAKLEQLQSEATKNPEQHLQKVIDQAQKAANALEMDEADTRRLIDAQLREAGWEADSVTLSYKEGVRPAKGRNMAIAEWPTTEGRADYVLFTGLDVVGVIEAKRQQKNVSAAIEQSKRYSRQYVIRANERMAGGPWEDYQVPFLFATNGRAYLRQLDTASGIWFLDARRPTNHSRAIQGWYTPQGLKALLAQDLDKAEANLAAEQTHYLNLRYYQLEAIAAVEKAIGDGRREALMAMATGTGKTRTALGLIYRLLKSDRFRRVLFLVDRTSLGEQAEGAFQNVKLENLQALTQIYDVKGLEDVYPEAETRLHIATIQGMVQRLTRPAQADQTVPVDRYDCIIVDECHRGYNLDREMTEGELKYRSHADYVSRYRRVLDHFDAVKIGLTATPALHTSQIFGAPAYEYSYRQAVIDGFLIDHEPPIRLTTRLAVEGITWEAGEEVAVLDTSTGAINFHELPDEVNIDINGFNTKVITESFNRVICKALAEEIDPTLDAKTLVFCANDLHADLVVKLLKEAFAEVYGDIKDDTVQKITGAADKPLNKIRRYKNEIQPNVAVTVDLLTTGIDVPKICNLVFLRRVKSRILYEQMLGRATRLCPDIHKEVFRIFDAVDLYSALRNHTTMKPVVTRPNLSFQQLFHELATVPEEDAEHRDQVTSELVAMLQRKKARLDDKATESFQTLAGLSPDELITLLKEGQADAVKSFVGQQANAAKFLDKFKPKGSQGSRVFIDREDREDELTDKSQGYGKGNSRPEDYLDGFKAYLSEHQDHIHALLVVTQRPRDLTRADLHKLALTLDQAGYPVSALRSAWRRVTNQDVAASLIGFIRQQALGSPLVPYDERVERALKRIQSRHTFTNPQRKWLERIGKQIKHEVIVDRDAIDSGSFKTDGGFRRLNKIFGGKLENILDELQDEVWKDVV